MILTIYLQLEQNFSLGFSTEESKITISESYWNGRVFFFLYPSVENLLFVCELESLMVPWQLDN